MSGIRDRGEDSAVGAGRICTEGEWVQDGFGPLEPVLASAAFRWVLGAVRACGEFGEGALRVSGKTVDYYNIASASFGLQIGAQQYSIVMVFLNDEAMQQFRNSKGWEAGVDGSVAVAEWGAGDDINSKNFKDPIVAFVFGNKGLMAGVSIEGSKITKIKK